LCNNTKAKFRYYGISPFEIEIIYDILRESFELEEEQLTPNDTSFVSMVEIGFPASYDESFFRWFSVERWFKIKEVLNEMAKRRGKRNIKIVFHFSKTPYKSLASVTFILKSKNTRQFEMAIERIEYMVDIVDIQLKSFPRHLNEIVYLYNENIHRWYPSIVATGNESSE
jgi:hypothetical protein